MANTVAGCTSEEPKREFSVPKALCGVAVPANALSRLLPATGQHLTSDHATPVSDAVTTCEVTVDGNMVLSVQRDVIDAGKSAWRVASYDHAIGHAKTGEGGTIAYVDRAAVSVVQCQEKGAEDEAVSTYIRTLKPGRQDESAMKTLISGYTAALKKEQPCRKGS
ncbi:hypothetical protein ACFVYF_35725 [Streptomyces sp. NPDC058274]|uniref:hypothetical protein n=1 Tax=Streptomyces sp. NPDC058274 TaxID=3346416 RepID=UPI0036EAF913